MFLSKFFNRSRKPKKIGLALGSGGVRGFAHLGVLKCLKEAGVPIYAIAGTSMGAIIGALFSSGASIAEIEKLVANLTTKTGARHIFAPAFQGGIAKSEKVKKYLSRHLAGKKIEDLTPKFACVATDLFEAKEVVFKKGNVLDAIGASFAIPGIFTPTLTGGRVLVDGAALNPVPIDIVKDLGADVVLAVNVICGPFVGKRADLDEAGEGGEGKMPSISAVILQSLSIYQDRLFRMRLKEVKPDILLEPELSDIFVFSFSRGMDAVEAGYKCAKAALPKILNMLS